MPFNVVATMMVPRPEEMVPADFYVLKRMDLVWINDTQMGYGIKPLWVANPNNDEMYDPRSHRTVFLGPGVQPKMGKLRKVFIGDEPVGTEFFIGPRSIDDLPSFDGPFVVAGKSVDNGRLNVQYHPADDPSNQKTLTNTQFVCCYMVRGLKNVETKVTGEAFRELSKTMKPGMSLKFKEKGSDSFAVGTFEGFDEVPSPANPSVMKKKIRIRTPSSGILKVDPTDPRNKIDVWIIRLPHELSTDEYVQGGGIWALCDDPVLDTVSKAKDGKHKVVIVKLKGDVATVKIVKGKVPWLVDVPKDTLKPIDENSELPEWAPSHSHGHRFSPGDVVVHVPSKKPYIVAPQQRAGTGHVSLTSPNGTEIVMLPVSELEFGGRLNQAGKVVTVSPMSSARLKAAPQKPKAPASVRRPEPPSQEV